MRKVIGYFLFVISFFAWAAIAILPFLNLTVEMGAVITTVPIVGGFAVLLIITSELLKVHG
jgi:hypothetical protein